MSRTASRRTIPSSVRRLRSPAHARSRARGISAHLLFRELDGRKVDTGERKWCIEVYGVHESAGARWVQVGLTGAPSHVVALRLGQKDQARVAMTALRSWL